MTIGCTGAVVFTPALVDALEDAGVSVGQTTNLSFTGASVP